MLTSTFRLSGDQPPDALRGRLLALVESNDADPRGQRSGLTGSSTGHNFRLRWSSDEIDGRALRLTVRISQSSEGSVVAVTVRRSPFHLVLAVLATLTLVAARSEVGILPSLLGVLLIAIAFPLEDRRQMRRAVR
mgnify:FL=1